MIKRDKLGRFVSTKKSTKKAVAPKAKAKTAVKKTVAKKPVKKTTKTCKCKRVSFNKDSRELGCIA